MSGSTARDVALPRAIRERKHPRVQRRFLERGGRAELEIVPDRIVVEIDASREDAHRHFGRTRLARRMAVVVPQHVAVERQRNAGDLRDGALERGVAARVAARVEIREPIEVPITAPQIEQMRDAEIQSAASREHFRLRTEPTSGRDTASPRRRSPRTTR
jgi:hypothetical protein